eukprot:1071812-Pelagomonas_calceolata.AAC.4
MTFLGDHSLPAQKDLGVWQLTTNSYHHLSWVPSTLGLARGREPAELLVAIAVRQHRQLTQQLATHSNTRAHTSCGCISVTMTFVWGIMFCPAQENPGLEAAHHHSVLIICTHALDQGLEHIHRHSISIPEAAA